KILIVDDEREGVNYLKRKLEQENFEPIIAQDGYQGLRIMAHQKVDAIITDSSMSEMDGYTFCKRVKEIKGYSDIPILVCTAYANEEKEFRKIGIDDYIVKPFKFDYLFESLNRVLNQISHKIKFKKVLVQADQVTGIKSAVRQIKEYGFRIDVNVVPESTNIIEETIRHQSDIVVFNALDSGKEPEIVITSLKSYVEFKGLKVVLYADQNNLDRRGKNCEIYLDDLKERCRQAGPDGWIGPLNRDSFLNLMFEYCKG
ncbi:MAG: response regulator, partial [Candidatus Omnitrophica bacterium]|nr:response regulator [Candidatus Omnitrophota bacterium]